MRLLFGAFILALCGVTGAASQKDAAAVLGEMRQALGGDAALDAIVSLSASSTVTMESPAGSRRISQEWFAVLSDKFLRVRRDRADGPLPFDVTYYYGFRGDELIRKTDSRGIQMPPEPVMPGVLDPAAVAARRVLEAKQAFARLAVILLGKSPATYPLQFTYAGAGQAAGRTVDVIGATGPDGAMFRLHVDVSTHLPAMVTWQAPALFITSTSSIVTARRGEVVSQTPERPNQVLVPSNLPQVEWSWILSDFKTKDGVTWPRRIEEYEAATLRERVGIDGYKVNPRIDPRRFEIK